MQGHGPHLILGDQPTTVDNLFFGNPENRIIPILCARTGDDQHIQLGKVLPRRLKQGAGEKTLFRTPEILGHMHPAAGQQVIGPDQLQIIDKLPGQMGRGIVPVGEDKDLFPGKEQAGRMEGLPAMEADCCQVVPGQPEPGARLLHGGERREDHQRFSLEFLAQPAADPEKQGVAAGQHPDIPIGQRQADFFQGRGQGADGQLLRRHLFHQGKMAGITHHQPASAQHPGLFRRKPPAADTDQNQPKHAVPPGCARSPDRPAPADRKPFRHSAGPLRRPRGSDHPCPVPVAGHESPGRC